MTTYIITKKHTYEPANDVYFAYSLEEALQWREQLLNVATGEEPDEWLIAEVFDERHWFVKLLFRLARKVNR